MQELCPWGTECVTLVAVAVCKPRSSEPVTSGVLLAASARGHDSHQLSPQPLASWGPPHTEGPQTLLSPRKVQGPEEPRVRSWSQR